MVLSFVYHLFTIHPRLTIPGYEGFQATEKGKLWSESACDTHYSLQHFHLPVLNTVLKNIWATRLLWINLVFLHLENFVATPKYG